MNDRGWDKDFDESIDYMLKEGDRWRRYKDEDTLYQIVIINGYPGSGKSTFVKYCESEKYGIVEYDTVAKYKNIAEIMKNGQIEKDEKTRRLISNLKRLDIEYRDGPFVDFVEFYNILPNDQRIIIFVHCREPEEIDKIKNRYPSTIRVLIEREGAKPADNYSDQSIKETSYDYRVWNSGHLVDLKKETEKFMTTIQNSDKGCERKNALL